MKDDEAGCVGCLLITALALVIVPLFVVLYAHYLSWLGGF